jgi:hypothetical protein
MKTATSLKTPESNRRFFFFFCLNSENVQNTETEKFNDSRAFFSTQQNEIKIGIQRFFLFLNFEINK